MSLAVYSESSTIVKTEKIILAHKIAANRLNVAELVGTHVGGRGEGRWSFVLVAICEVIFSRIR